MQEKPPPELKVVGSVPPYGNIELPSSSDLSQMLELTYASIALVALILVGLSCLSMTIGWQLRVSWRE